MLLCEEASLHKETTKEAKRWAKEDREEGGRNGGKLRSHSNKLYSDSLVGVLYFVPWHPG